MLWLSYLLFLSFLLRPPLLWSLATHSTLPFLFPFVSSHQCFTQNTPSPYYHYGPPIYQHCQFSNVCLVQHQVSKCKSIKTYRSRRRSRCATLKELLYFLPTSSSTAPSANKSSDLPKFLYTCPSNYVNSPWCKLVIRTLRIQNTTQLTSYLGPNWKATTSTNLTYITGRWQHANPVEYLFEGFWGPLWASFLHFGLSNVHHNVSFAFLDPVIMQRHDWATILFHHRTVTILPTNYISLWCYSTVLVGTPLIYHAVPVNISILLMRHLRSVFFAYANLTHSKLPLTVASSRQKPVLRVLIYIKPTNGFVSMGGTFVNPKLMTDMLNAMSPFQGYSLHVQNLSVYWNTSPKDQLATMQPIDLYISDGGTTAFMGLFMTAGSAAIRLAKCPARQCRCDPRSHTMYYWFSFNASNILYLWYTPPGESFCVNSHAAYADIIVEPKTFKQMATTALQYVIARKYHNLR